MYKIAILIIGFQLLFLAACSTDQQNQTKYNIDSLRAEFNQYKAEKDSAFIHEEWSPLPDSIKQHFAGLNYFAYDPKWRFEGKLVPAQETDTIKIIGSQHGKGRKDLRPAIRYGSFHFNVDRKGQELEIIKILPREEGGPSYLFLGFWDETSEIKTYGGGRYVDLEENEENYYVIDFNYAYNPYCAYNPKYSCAVPPLSNRLDVSVFAGEMKFKDH